MSRTQHFSSDDMKPIQPSARLPRHAVDFFCNAPRAENVFVTGDFNKWRADTTPMQRGPDGCWVAHLELPHGHHCYLFLLDGQPMLDPNANGRVWQRNPWLDAASLVAVS
jgi:1,4-alpha-glucan branching enzyme